MATEIICPTRADWLARRREGVTASEISAILGLSPWLSAFSLYWQKITDYNGPEDGAKVKARGLRLERLIREDFQAAHPELLTAVPLDAHRQAWGSRAAVATVEADRIHGGPPHAVMFAHADRPWQMATPDALAWPGHVVIDSRHPHTSVAPVELKTANNRHGWGPSGTDIVPAHYRAQLLWQMDVLDADEGWLAAWIGLDDYREYLIKRDDEDIAVMREAAEQFLDSVDTEQPPPIDGLKITTATLRHLHPRLTNEDAEVPAQLADAWDAKRHELSTIKAEYRRIENELRALMGSSARAVTPDGDVVATRSVHERGAYQVAACTIDRLWGRRTTRD